MTISYSLLILLTCIQDLVEVTVLNCDLSNLPLNDFDRYENPKTKRPYYSACMICKMMISGTTLDIEIYYNNIRICKEQIKELEMELGSRDSRS